MDPTTHVPSLRAGGHQTCQHARMPASRRAPHRRLLFLPAGNRLYMLAARSNSRQWRKAGDKLVKIRDSFTVPQKIDD